MKMSLNRFYPIIVGFMAVSLLIGFLAWRSWVNQNGLLGQKQAIQNAIQACNPAHGFQPVEQPTEIEAKLIWGGAKIPPYNSDPARPVWVVWMKGRWILVGGPRPAPDPSNPTPQPGYDTECVIKIDARTGSVSISGY